MTATTMPTTVSVVRSLCRKAFLMTRRGRNTACPGSCGRASGAFAWLRRDVTGAIGVDLVKAHTPLEGIFDMTGTTQPVTLTLEGEPHMLNSSPLELLHHPFDLPAGHDPVLTPRNQDDGV